MELESWMANMIWLRKHHTLSKREMAKRLGISVKTWNKIEKGQFPPQLGVNVICNVRKSFGIELNDQFVLWPEN